MNAVEERRNLIEDIVGNDTRKRTEALKQLYKDCFPMVRSYIYGKNGTEQEALDVFQDGVVVLYENIISNKFRMESSMSTYLYGICRNIWHNKFRDTVKQNQLRNSSDTEVEIEVGVDSNLLDKILNRLKNDCKTVLVGFYYQCMSLAELKNDLGLGSVQAVKNKKHRCLKYLMAIIKEEGLNYESFILEE